MLDGYAIAVLFIRTVLPLQLCSCRAEPQDDAVASWVQDDAAIFGAVVRQQ